MAILSKLKIAVLFLLAVLIASPAFGRDLSVAKGNHDFIRDVQIALVAKGYDVGTVDGLWGGNTARAMDELRDDFRQAYWDAYEFRIAGSLDQLLDELKLSPSDYPTPVDLSKRVTNPPSCADINKAWQWYRAVTNLQVFKNPGSFSCPSTTANAAIAIYLLDALDIRDKSGKEKFDYFHYVFPSTGLIFPSEKEASTGSSGGIGLGTLLLATHDKNGQRLSVMNVSGPETLIHERRHFDPYVVKHVKCLPTDEFRDCDTKLTLLLDLPNGLENRSVGAYSMSVAYLIDIIRFADPNHRVLANYHLGIILKERFISGGVTQTQINKINDLIDTDFAL